MSFDYLKDLFGKFRNKKKTKYTDIEQRAILLLQEFYDRKISAHDFGKAMSIIDDEFHKLMYDDKANTYVFDEDTPGWLNLFLGNRFRPWYRFHQMFNEAKKNHELTLNPRWPEVVNREKIENENLFSAIKYCIEEHRKC